MLLSSTLLSKLQKYGESSPPQSVAAQIAQTAGEDTGPDSYARGCRDISEERTVSAHENENQPK